MTNPFRWFAIALPARRRDPKDKSSVTLLLESGIDFEPTHLIYHITVRNPGDATVRDVMITPAVERGPFRILESPRGIRILEPQSFGTASFRVEPTGEPAEVELSGRVRYRPMKSAMPIEAIVSPMRLDLRPVETRPVYITPGGLRERASVSFSIQESFALTEDAETVFPRAVAAVETEGLERVEEKVNRSNHVFTGQASLHGLDHRGNSYAARIVASRKESSTLRLLVFVAAEESLFGFFWRIRRAVQTATGARPHHP